MGPGSGSGKGVLVDLNPEPARRACLWLAFAASNAEKLITHFALLGFISGCIVEIEHRKFRILLPKVLQNVTAPRY